MRSMSTPNLTERAFYKRKKYMNLPVCNIIVHVGVEMARDRYYREVVAESPDRKHYLGFEDQFCGFHWPWNELNYLHVFCTGPCNFHKNVGATRPSYWNVHTGFTRPLSSTSLAATPVISSTFIAFGTWNCSRN
ncbi:hypothetical protein ACJW30_01G132400 [Castanea mollissima]